MSDLTTIYESMLVPARAAVLTENSENTFSRKVKVHFNYNPDNMIDDISIQEIAIKYDIDIEYRDWGIKSIEVDNIRGPESINLEVSYYINKEWETNTKTIPLKIDWTKPFKTLKNKGEGVISVDDIVIDLQGNIKQGFVVAGMEIEVFTL